MFCFRRGSSEEINRQHVECRRRCGHGLWAVAKKELMVRRAFTMKLFPGFEEEYKKRHDKIWPELKELIKKSGVREYSIYLDEGSLTLFGVMQVEDPALLQNLPDHPVMKKWWA